LREEHFMKRQLNFDIERLGECSVPSPLKGQVFVKDQRVLHYTGLADMQGFLAEGVEPPSSEVAGPRDMIFFDPVKVKAGIVTCGGLCPGLNDMVRAIVLSLYHHYGVRSIYGFRFGFEGLVPRLGHAPMELNPQVVSGINKMGGTILGTSRGPQDIKEMVDTLEQMNIGILFAIGGDGTLKGASAISEEIKRRGVKIAVVGIPKTIDNDISFIDRSFGFYTAGSEARKVVVAAHNEARAQRNGVGLVKLMGRDSGFISAYAALAASEVDFCLVPEIPFSVEVFLDALKERLLRGGHAVVVVSEGAGRSIPGVEAERDASGNVKYGDIGVFLRDSINEHFKKIGMELNVKYIDPSYMIRGVPADADDAAFCLLLGFEAVHAGMTGRTNLVVGHWHGEFIHIPIRLAVSERQKIDPDGWVWSRVLACTGQPANLE
jgi:6-phosphofructokinase 1